MVRSFPVHVHSSSETLTISSSEEPKLAQDVVVEVLKRLPMESLLRFRCVSRSWRSTIDDPRFVALHLNHSSLDASNWYLVGIGWFDPVRRLCSVFPTVSLALPSQSVIDIPFATPPNRYRFVGSCNGLICVTQLSRDGYGQTMNLWNLFTRKHKAVRPSGPEHQIFSTETARIVLGFGFDAGLNDYKIVRILYFLDDHRTAPQVEIYSLSTDSWRSLECEVPALNSPRPAVFLNGNLHWFSFKFALWDKGGYGSIVLFDVAGEVFDEMALPEVIMPEDKGSLTVHVAILNDLLAVFINQLDAVVLSEPYSVCSVWVMTEYGLPESWTKLYSFVVGGMVTGFDGFARNGELLMETNAGQRVSRNPITGQYANLPPSAQCELVIVVKSLVSL